MKSKYIVLFDGHCLLCQNSVQFILKRDPQAKFLFASLTSEKGVELLKEAGFLSSKIDSIVLIQDGHYFTESSAALRIAKALSGLWPMLYIFILLPVCIRNSIYRFIAKNRYRWFGRDEFCMIPSEDIKHRFL
jgi:predicted DCC family thiol-disulfide oxidoreductase YuxK